MKQATALLEPYRDDYFPELNGGELVPTHLTVQAGGPAQAPQPRKAGWEEHFRSITKLLLSLEASTWQVGIPLLIQTPNMQSQRIVLDQPLDDYVRIALVNVPTETIALYVDELFAAEDKDPLKMFAPELKFWDRYGGALAATALLAVASGTLAFVTSGHWDVGLAVSLLTAGSCGAVLIPCSSQMYRKESFKTVLRRELARRTGSGSSGGLQVYATS